MRSWRLLRGKKKEGRLSEREVTYPMTQTISPLPPLSRYLRASDLISKLDFYGKYCFFLLFPALECYFATEIKAIAILFQVFSISGQGSL
jgi:hypothetical protein